MDDLKIITATPPDRENEVAEIWYKGECWAEISQEQLGSFNIEFYNHPQSICWEIPFEKAIESLKRAKERLLTR